jgi:hypothetical protein
MPGFRATTGGPFEAGDGAPALSSHNQSMRVCALLLLAAVCFAQNRDEAFAKLADRYFDEVVVRFDPVQGTAAGFHQYDVQLPSGSKAEVQSQISALRKYQAEVERFEAKGLSPAVAADRELVLSQIRGGLLALENIRMWEKNPDIYSSLATNAIFVIMSRTFAPPVDRMKAATVREKLIPRLLDSARANLTNPPRIYTEVAIEQMPGIVSFFQNDVPKAFQGVVDDEFRKTNQAAIDALKAYEAWMKSDLLPRSKGDFRIGAENYRKKPLDRLLEIGYDDLHRNQAEFKRVAAQIDPKRTAQEILDEAEKDHPAGDKLLPTFRDVLGGLRSFVETKRIVTIPSPVAPIVEETPPFMRGSRRRRWIRRGLTRGSRKRRSSM